MPRITYRSFTGGEVDLSLAARYDLQKAGTFLQVCENMVVNTIGDVERRPGTLFMEDLGEGDAFLLPFQFNSEPSENYILIFQANKVFVRRIPVDEGDTQDLTYEISYADRTTVYSLADLPDVSYAQVGDILYLAHRDYPLQKIIRSGTYPRYTWALEIVTFNQTIAAPRASGISSTRGYEYYVCGEERFCCQYELNETSCLGYKVSAVDSDGVESTASNECQITFRYPTDWITGDSVTFCWTWSDNGSGSCPEYYNVYRDSAGYYGFIGTTCGNICCFQDQNFEPDTAMTPKEDWYPFSGDNFPGTVIFHQQRMWLGGTKNEPTTIYASRTSDFESFRKSRPLQDDDPLEYQLATGSIDDIMWLKSFGNLFVGTSGGEFSVSSAGAVLTPTDVQINVQSSWGSRGVMPLLVGNAILHVRRNGSRIMEFAYNWENDSYSGTDLTLLAPHIVDDSPIRQWCFVQSPVPRIWAVREDGVLICCTYVREQNVYAWSRHITEGEFVSIISLCGNKEDEIVMLVKRTIGDEVHYLLERFAPRFDDNTIIEDAFFVDCGVILNNNYGENELESSSLAHLIGKTVSVLNVGSLEKGHIVADDGKLSLYYGVFGKVIVGLPFTSVMAPLPVDSEGDFGSTVGLQRALGKTAIRVHRSGVFEYAATKDGWLADRSAYKDAEFYEAPILPENYGEPFPPFSGTVEVVIPGSQAEDSSLYIQTNKPTPLRVLSITADINFGEMR